MAVETLGDAWKAGWRIIAHCYWLGPSKSGKRIIPWCDTQTELDVKTLVWTRGERFPLEQLASRLRCPKCGFTKIRVFFSVPNDPVALAARKKIDLDDYGDDAAE